MKLLVRTFGRFELVAEGVVVPQPPTQKARALLAYLLAARTRDVSREQIAERFWHEFEPDRAREGLRTALSSIRRCLRDAGVDPREVLQADRAVVRWISEVQIDTEELTSVAQSAMRWREAAKLYRGDFLEGNYEEWVVAEREHYAHLYEGLLSRAVRELGDIEAARLLLTRNPYDESAYAALLEAHRLGGHHSAARTLWRRYRTAMREAGILPSAQVLERFADLDADGEVVLTVPFVARRDELDRIERGLRACAQNQPYTAIVSGEAGIGKTALLERIDARARELGYRSFGIEVHDGGAAAVWGPLYHRLVGKPIDAAVAQASDVPAAIADAIASALSPGAVVFVDDAHELHGGAAVAFVELMRLARQKPFALVAAMRTEGLATIGQLVESHTDERMTLGPLARQDFDAMLLLALGSESGQLADVLYARSGGHPLFFVALLDSLVRDKALERESGRWRLTRPLDAQLELPKDLRGSIDARLRAAGDDASVVACALAIEPSANAEQIAAALRYDLQRVFDALDRLLGFGLIGEEETRFTFLHDVVREVAATVLNAGRRVALHREYARLYAGDVSADGRVHFARHLRAAGMMMPAAQRYLEAARIALRAYAFHDALQWCADGLTCLERTQHATESQSTAMALNETRAQAAMHAGDLGLAKTAVDDFARSARAVSTRVAIGAALVARAALDGVRGESTQRLADALEARGLAREHGDAHLTARAEIQAAGSSRYAALYDEAAAFAGSALAMAASIGDRVAQYAAAEELLRTQISWWHFGGACEALSTAQPLAEGAGISALVRLSCLRAWLACLMERFDEAERALERADGLLIDLARRRDSSPLDPGFPLYLVRYAARYVRGIVAVSVGRWDDAAVCAAACLQVAPLGTMPPYGHAAMRLELGARLSRDATVPSGDVPPIEPAGAIRFTTDCPALLRARLAARRRSSAAPGLLRAALDALEERANAMPLDCDRSFSLLASASDDCGERAIAVRAAAQADRYSTRRLTAAAQGARGKSFTMVFR